MSDFLSEFSLHEDKNKLFSRFYFVQNSHVKKEFPLCALTLFSAGSMRNIPQNANRNKVFTQIGLDLTCIAPIDLIHSKTVYAIQNVQEISQKSGDGIITVNKSIIPTVTVADCMPIYLYEPQTGCFGVLHSGWKGTGIILEALQKAQSQFGANPADFCVILGPHIQSCCYTIEKERADYFKNEFCSECVIEQQNRQTQKTDFRLSLAKANLAILQKAGVKQQNIAVCIDCTACSPFLGSFRRETAHLPSNTPLQTRYEHFTPMSAFITTKPFIKK